MNTKEIIVPIVTLEGANIPKYAKYGDAGFDIATVESGTVLAGETVLVKTGLKMAVPVGYELQLRPRSGMSLKTGLRIPNSPATIDSGFRGEIKVIIQNTSSEDYHYEKGDKICQGVFNEVPKGLFHLVGALPDSDRGERGFGSTGK